MKKLHLLAAAVSMGFGLVNTPVFAEVAPAKPENVLQVIKSHKELSKFADLISSAGIESELTQKTGSVTVFAPNNDAMEKIPSDVMKKAKADKEGLKSLANYHVISGSAVFAGNIKGRRAGPSTANGEMIGFDGMGKELKVNEAVIVTPDLSAPNGVVHVINAPLVPLSLNTAAQTKLKDAQEAETKKMEERMKERESKMEAERAKVEAEQAKNAPKADKAAKAAAPVATPEAPSAPTTPTVAGASAPTAPAAAAPAAKEEKSGWKKLFGF